MNHGRHFVLLLAALAFSGCSSESEPEPGPGGPVAAKVMSFNVLCSFCDDTYEPWNDRVSYFADIIARHDPDLIGFQEFLLRDEVEQVAALSPGYGTVFLKDAHGPLFNDYADALLFYKTARFEVLNHGFYWLSDTPDTPWSPGWAGGQLWRLVAWAHMRQNPDGREFYFATTHVDNNTPNQENSAPLILSRTQPWAESMPALVVGDFNSKPDSVAYSILTQGVGGQGFALQNTFDRAESWEAIHNQPTPPDFDPGSRIDHIFVASPKDWSCSRWEVDQFVYGPTQNYPSDHFAISAAVRLE